MAAKRSAEANMRWNLRRRLNDKEYRAAVRDLRRVKAECAERGAGAASRGSGGNTVLGEIVRAAILRRP